MRLRKPYVVLVGALVAVAVGYHIKRRAVLGNEAFHVDREPPVSHRTGWSLADSLRLLELHYRGDQDDLVIDLTRFDQEPAPLTLVASA